MTKRKLIALLSAIIMTVLLLPIGAFATDTTIVTINGQAITDTAITTAGYALQTKTVTVTNKSGGSSTYTYTGYKLSELLTLAGVTSYTNGITAVSGDYAKDYALTDIDDNTILAVTKTPDATPPKTDCPVLAPCSSTSAGFYTKNIVSINEILPAFSVKFGDKTITNADVKKLDVVSYSSTSTSSTGKTTTAIYKGYKLSDVLTLAGIDYTNGITVTVTDNATYTYKYSKDVISNPKTLFAITKKGATTDGPFIAPCDSASSQDYTKFVATIAATPVPAAPATVPPVTTTAPATKSNNPKTDDASSLISSGAIIIVTSSFLIALIEVKRKKVEG